MEKGKERAMVDALLVIPEVKMKELLTSPVIFY